MVSFLFLSAVVVVYTSVESLSVLFCFITCDRDTEFQFCFLLCIHEIQFICSDIPYGTLWAWS